GLASAAAGRPAGTSRQHGSATTPRIANTLAPSPRLGVTKAAGPARRCRPLREGAGIRVDPGGSQKPELARSALQLPQLLFAPTPPPPGPEGGPPPALRTHPPGAPPPPPGPRSRRASVRPVPRPSLEALEARCLLPPPTLLKDFNPSPPPASPDQLFAANG